MSKQKIFPLLTLATSLLCPQLHAAEPDGESLEAIPLPEVLTPVRLKQPRTEVPASVSVIDAEMIAASGIRELPELLRIVPGMAVGARSGWDYGVSYHGTNRHNSHRMQVMIDGRSIYQAGLATIDWSDIPLAMEDIERIEVTRGPNTAAYGANAFLGTVNIITKHPDDSPHLRVKALGGNRDTRDFYASTSGTADIHSYRVSAASRRDDGFDEDADGNSRRDSKDLHFFNGRWLLAPSEHWTLDLQAGYTSGDKDDDINDFDATPPDISFDTYFASATSQHYLSTTNSLKWQLDYQRTDNTNEWRTCMPASELDDSFPSSLLVCGDVDNNIRAERTDIDVQDTWLSGRAWKLVSGMHAQQQRVDSETYYSGTVTRSTYQLFANVEYRFSPLWLATAAGSQEYLDHNEEAFSPRLALLFTPRAEHTFRLVYSEAIRTPDLFESDLAWHYTARNVTIGGESIPGMTTLELPTNTSPDDIHEEHIRSREFGYYGLWLDRHLEIDIKFFNDDLDELISDIPQWGGYEPRNTNTVKQRGGETEIKWQLNDNVRLLLSAALIDSNATNWREEDLTPHKSGAFAAIFTPWPDWQYASFYYYADDLNHIKLERWDNRVAHNIRIASTQLTLSATVQHYFDTQSDLLSDNVYDSQNRIYVAADLSF